MLQPKENVYALILKRNVFHTAKYPKTLIKLVEKVKLKLDWRIDFLNFKFFLI